MSRMKDIWLQSWEQEYYKALDDGASERKAQRIADQNADGNARDRLADLADAAHQRQKDADL